ncbi:MAG: diacylglycerol kinase [Bacilli bacterium]|nr:diacylglycerol kinase [Bacilli bacterium]
MKKDVSKKLEESKRKLEKEKDILKNEVFVKKKKFGLKRFKNSFINSFHGIAHAYVNEQSLSIIFVATIVMVALGFIVKLDRIEWMFVILHFGLLIVAELLNTSIEAVVDKASPEIHPLAKVSKDTASGAEFTLFLVTVINFSIIYLPKLITLFK